MFKITPEKDPLDQLRDIMKHHGVDTKALKRFYQQLARIHDEHISKLPAWSYLPVEKWSDVLALEKNMKDLYQSIPNIIYRFLTLTSVVTWGVTKSVFVIDEELFTHLYDSSLLEAVIPSEIIMRIPNWSVYVQLPEGVVRSKIDSTSDTYRLYGYYACLISKPKNGTMLAKNFALISAGINYDDISCYLVIVGDLRLKGDINYIRYVLPIGNSISFRDSLKAVLSNYGYNNGSSSEEQLISMELSIRSISTTLMYLCSVNAEITKNDKDFKDYKRRVDKVPSIITEWDVGRRIGAELRSNRTSYESSQQHNNKTSIIVRPHVRRAHWHSYRTGKGKCNIEVKWLPPIFVNCNKNSIANLPQVTRDVIS